MHLQKLCIFGVRPSFEAFNEDPDIRHEVLRAAAMAGFAAVLLTAGLVFLLRGPRRWAGGLAVAASLALFAGAAPHFSVLLVPAEPTFYFRSPTGFSTASINAGAALYPAHCAVCHGAHGAGDGPIAAHLPVPPANLLAAHLLMHPDGQLFWWLTHGIEAPEGGTAMPGFPQLAEDERWNLIDFIRARNAGRSVGAGGAFTRPMPAPDFAVTCASGPTSLVKLRGQVLRILFAAPAGLRLQATGMTTILVGPAAAPPPAAGFCRADDQSVPGAYAIVTGQAGEAVLVDAGGWLRRVSGDPAGLSASQARGARPALDMGDMNM